MIDTTCSIFLHTIYFEFYENKAAIPINRTMGCITRNNVFFYREQKKQHFSGICSSDQKCMVEMHNKFHENMFIHVGDNHSLKYFRSFFFLHTNFLMSKHCNWKSILTKYIFYTNYFNYKMYSLKCQKDMWSFVLTYLKLQFSSVRINELSYYLEEPKLS